MGAVCAAMAALKAVESDLAADYASSKDYARLKNHAEANGLALKVRLFKPFPKGFGKYGGAYRGF